ncbi:ABC transporter substrate-binding protein [Paenibacillus fonticola]|uniref:ABC transporter substrate-binding protein n=1 Tax=Paenibacillus fonticola TaxID=379896 RepID=UPI00036638C0|nr:extracellular solute-binding protein [Paenibacillus fonticola]
MTFRRRATWLSLTLALLLIVLSACGKGGNIAGSSGNKSAKEAADTEKTTLTLLIDNQTAIDGIQAVADEIKRELNIETKIELRPGGTEGDNVVKTRLATSDMADLMFYNSGSLFKALNPQEYFVDLTNEPFMDHVLDSFKDTVSVDGKVYGIPGGSTVGGAWLYNKKIYSELGLSVPKTWDELLANNDKIKEAGYTPVIGSFSDSWTSQLVVLADYYNVHSLAPNFAEDYTYNKAKYATTPEALRSFEKLQSLRDKKHFNDDATATKLEDALAMLAEGKAAHYPILTLVLTNINANYPEMMDDIGAFAQPSDTADVNGLTIWMPGGIYANKEGSKIDAAKKWMEFFVSPEGVKAYLTAMKPEGPMPIKGVELPDDTYSAVKEMLPYFESGKTAPALEFYSPIKGPSLEQITVEVATGISSAAEGAAKYDSDVEKQALQLGLEGW